MTARRRDVKKTARRTTPTAPSSSATFLSSPSGLMVMVGGAVVVVVALIMLGGGFARPIAPLPTAAPGAAGTSTAPTGAAGDQTAVPLNPTALLTCAGKPCPGLGPESASVTLIEVSDFSCSHCLDYHTKVWPLVKDAYVTTGKVRYLSHVFGFSPQSQYVAVGALCAADQGRYFEFQDLAFKQQVAAPGADARAGIETVGKAVVPDFTAFQSCVADGRYVNAVTRSSDEATAAGVTYTPSLFVAGELIDGALTEATIRAKVDAALAQGKAGS
jgi:protein-disulfide isomerase